LQDVDVHASEPTTKVSRRRRVGNPPGAQGIQENFIIPAQFYVLQTGALTQRVVGEIENMIRLVKRSMKLKQIQMAVNGVDETDLPSQNMESTNTSVCDASRPAGNLILNIARRKHRLFATVVILLVETAIDPTLAVGQFLGYSCAHSKSLFVSA
jgi:hypothetical protein